MHKSGHWFGQIQNWLPITGSIRQSWIIKESERRKNETTRAHLLRSNHLHFNPICILISCICFANAHCHCFCCCCCHLLSSIYTRTKWCCIICLRFMVGNNLRKMSNRQQINTWKNRNAHRHQSIAIERPRSIEYMRTLAWAHATSINKLKTQIAYFKSALEITKHTISFADYIVYRVKRASNSD